MLVEREHEGTFFTERRVLGLLGATLIATVAYGVVTSVTMLEGVIFFVIFALVFTLLNYALWRYE